MPYLLDACQAVGQLPVDVDALGCDFLSATGRKYLRAPRGTGFLYVRRSRLAGLEPPFLDVHAARWAPGDAIEMRDDARRFETWEHSVANRLGLGRGGRLRAGPRRRRHRGTGRVARDLVARAARRRSPGSRCTTTGVEQCGIVTFTIDGVDAYELAARLRTRGHQHLGVDHRLRPLRLRGARARRRRARVGALLQHRGRARLGSSARSRARVPPARRGDAGGRRRR